MRKIIIAIDGYSSSGKSTLATDLASVLGYACIDTGAMYRAVTLYLLEKGILSDSFPPDDVKILAELPDIKLHFEYSTLHERSEIFLNGKNAEDKIRTLQVSKWVSRVSIIPEMRQKMVEMQRAMGKQGGVVLEGRDIGTVVFPHAGLKLFMTADIDVRTLRRKMELIARGHKVTTEEVKNDIMRRDKEDTTRKESPLHKADDAILLDTTKLTREQQLGQALRLAKQIIMSSP